VITLSFSSLKGGVGKTTCALNAAYSFAKRGWKTLLVDIDPQGSIGLSLSTEKNSYAGFYEKNTQGKPLSELTIKTRIENLHILMNGQIPGSEISKWCGSMQSGEILQNFFNDCEADGFDLVIVETPSGLHGPTEGALRQSKFVLVPLQCEPLAMRSLMQLIDFLGYLQEQGSQCVLIGVILTMVDADAEESVTIRNQVSQMLPDLICGAVIPRDSLILTASSKGLPLALVRGAATPVIALTFDQLAAELEPKLGLQYTDKTDEQPSFLV
jgi:chromosome partitioning protein